MNLRLYECYVIFYIVNPFKVNGNNFDCKRLIENLLSLATIIIISLILYLYD